VKLENKKEKILQYGERVWKITEGSEEERVDVIINKTVEFFESLGIKTKLSDYGVGADIIPTIKERFISRGMVAIGERFDLTPDEIGKVLEMQLN